jgi:predicted nucleic acid-binding Zn ribbon protein
LRHAPISGDVVGRIPAKPARENDDDAWDDDEDHEGPSRRDRQRFNDVTRSCPACGKQVFDDASVCYHCGELMDAPRGPKANPLWKVVIVIVLVLMFAGIARVIF